MRIITSLDDFLNAFRKKTSNEVTFKELYVSVGE